MSEHIQNYWLLYLIIIVILVWYFSNHKIKNSKNFKTDSIKTLVRQASRWSVASTQDQNVLISVLHANYGAGYLWALRDIATDTEIENATGIDVLKFRDEITKAQDEANKKMIQSCPSFAPEKSYLEKLASE